MGQHAGLSWLFPDSELSNTVCVGVGGAAHSLSAPHRARLTCRRGRPHRVPLEFISIWRLFTSFGLAEISCFNGQGTLRPGDRNVRAVAVSVGIMIG